MVLGWLSGGAGASVDELIARKKYERAIQLLNEQFRQGDRKPRLRLQMADLLILAGRQREAAPLLRGLADEFAVEGFAAKAIAVLKKAQRIEPRGDVEKKLAALINQQRERDLPEPATMVPGQLSGFEFGIEEIEPATEPVGATTPEPVIEEAGIEVVEPEPGPGPAPAPAASPRAVVKVSEPPTGPGSDGAEGDSFGDELLGVLHEVLAEAAASPVQAPPEGAPESPLFSDFSAEELAAVIGGLELISFDPGDIIITEGEPGDSLFVLTSGVAKAFLRDEHGRNAVARVMEEGSFFGEISILSGQPRTATVTAATRCDLLELDRPRLDEITATHPRVLQVLRRFYEERVSRA